MLDGPQRDWSCGWVGEGRNNIPNQLKQSDNAGVKMFGNTPVLGYGENAALHMGLVLPGDLKWFRNYPTTSVFRAAHSHMISEVCVSTRIYWHIPPDWLHRSPCWSSTMVRYGYFLYNNWWACWKMEKCSLPHAAMHVIHLIIFRDFALLMSLLNLHPKCCQNFHL